MQQQDICTHNIMVDCINPYFTSALPSDWPDDMAFSDSCTNQFYYDNSFLQNQNYRHDNLISNSVENQTPAYYKQVDVTSPVRADIVYIVCVYMHVIGSFSMAYMCAYMHAVQSFISIL